MMSAKIKVLATAVFTASLAGCSQQAAIPDAGANTTISNQTGSSYSGSRQGGANTCRGQANCHQHNGRWHAHKSTSPNHSHASTQPYKQGSGVGYNRYGQGSYQGGNANRYGQSGQQGASGGVNRYGQAGSTHGSNHYAQGGQQGQYQGGSAAQRGQQHNQYNQTHAGNRGQYAGGSRGSGNNAQNRYGNSANSHAGGQQYTAADLKNPKSLLSKRIVYFDYDRATIKHEFKPVLNAHATYLKANPNESIRLEGHADDRGSREYNLALSERRARSVRDYLAGRGVRVGQMHTVGYGEEMPAVRGQGERSWSKNRRVVIKY